MHRFLASTRVCFLVLTLAATPILVKAQTFTRLFDFDGPNGATPGPAMQLVQGFDGKLWGTTSAGGSAGDGTIFNVRFPNFSLNIAYSFDSADAYVPVAGLTLDPNGRFYGVTEYGGENNLGNVFSFSPNGTPTALTLGFDGSIGSYPVAGLLLASSGILYGTAGSGGAYDSGTIFEIHANGNSFMKVTDLPSASPYLTLVQGRNGLFYGALPYGGLNSKGEVFKMDVLGGISSLHSFSGSDGENPVGSLVEGANGDFYGTTYVGGMDNVGTIFAITPGGTFKTIHNFRFGINASNKGFNPDAALVEGSDGNLYGVAAGGGLYGYGVIFRITPARQYTVLHSFNFEEAEYAGSGGLVQATDGNFYGTLSGGGANQLGLLYRLSVGLAPFVKLLPGLGKVGSTVDILGTNLTGATTVTFNGTPATFTVASGARIKAVVPTGATSGPVQVTTPNGTLLSNTTFQVH